MELDNREFYYWLIDTVIEHHMVVEGLPRQTFKDGVYLGFLKGKATVTLNHARIHAHNHNIL